MTVRVPTIRASSGTRLLSSTRRRLYQVSQHLTVNSGTELQSPGSNTQGIPGVAREQIMAEMKNLTLNNGVEIPLLGYGTGTAQGKFGNTDPSNIDRNLVGYIITAIKAGYYHLDGAEVYGNESELGVAIKECGVPRDKLFVTTKCSGTLVQDTEESFVESLKKLQLDYVDLYLIHAPFFAKSPADLQAKWAGFEKILASGRAKAIGVSNFLQSDLEVILETAKVIPSINQIEYHPYLQHGNLIPFSKSHNIATCAYGPLTAITRASGGPLGGIYEELAKKYNVTPAEIALRWVIDQDIVALTTSSKEERLKAYLKATEFKLTPEEVETISKVGADRHYRSFWQDKFDKDDRR